MTITQLKNLQEAGFTLEQIVKIGEIFDPDRPKTDKKDETATACKSTLKSAEEARKAYEKGRNDAQEEEFRKKMGPLIRGSEFERRCEEFQQEQQRRLFLGPMEIPHQVKGGIARSQSLTPERRSEIARSAALVRWNTQPHIEK